MMNDRASPAAPDGPAAILIVEDDPGAVEAFEYMLKAEGYRVQVAVDAPAAWAAVARAAPAAVVIDLHLPVTDGLALVRRLRATARHARLPIPVVTGDYFLEEPIAHELERLGAPLFFKPLWEEDLVRIVRGLTAGAS